MQVGVLASGGNSPGMNNAVTAIVKSLILSGHKPILIKNGFCGIFAKDFEEPNIRHLESFNTRGNVYIGSSRCKEMYDDKNVEKAADIIKAEGIEALVVIGGNGSYLGASRLSKYGVNVICLPGTIDNDIAST
jgi:6-phosphofructokinase 1